MSVYEVLEICSSEDDDDSSPDELGIASSVALEVVCPRDVEDGSSEDVKVGVTSPVSLLLNPEEEVGSDCLS